MFKLRALLWCVIFYQLLYVTNARPGFGTGLLAGFGTAALLHHVYAPPPMVPYTAMSPPTPLSYYQPPAMMPGMPLMPPTVVMAPPPVMFAPPPPPTVFMG